MGSEWRLGIRALAAGSGAALAQCGQQWRHEPAKDRAPLEHDRGGKSHVGLEHGARHAPCNPHSCPIKWLRTPGGERPSERYIADHSAPCTILLIGISVEAEDDHLTAAERSVAAGRHERLGRERGSFGYDRSKVVPRGDHLTG